MALPAPPAVAARHPELAACLKAAAAGDHRPAYLLVGEPFDTRAAAEALLDVLVPAARRAFNLELYDGRTTPLTTVLDSLRMPGFFSGLKAIWVRESPLFLSGEKRPELTKAMLTAWAAGRETEAAEKLLTLVAMAGWSQDEFRAARWSELAKTRVRDVFGEALTTEQMDVLTAVQAACVARDLGVSAYSDDSATLLAALDAGLPPHAVLLFTASTVDARKRLVKRLREVGAVIELSVGRERSGALSREAIEGVVHDILRDFGKRLAPDAQQLVTQRAGADLARLASETQKLCLFVGEEPTITVADVQTVFRDMAASWIFDFTSALAARQVGRALSLLRGLDAQGEPALRMLAMIGREVRLLLVARECLDGPLQGKWRTGMSYNVFQARLLPLLDADTKEAFGGAHPFVLYRRFQDAERITAAMLRAALGRLAALDVRLKSSRSDAFVLLEAFVVDWCVGRPGPRAERFP
jgi:DNA polymerase III delta subunit